MNLTELYETFKIQGEVEVFYEIDQSGVNFINVIRVHFSYERRFL